MAGGTVESAPAVGDGVGLGVGVGAGVVGAHCVDGTGEPVGVGEGDAGSSEGVASGDGVAVSDGSGEPDVDGDGFGVVVPGTATAATIRVAPKYSVHQTGETFTTSPNVGACTILPCPM